MIIVVAEGNTSASGRPYQAARPGVLSASGDLFRAQAPVAHHPVVDDFTDPAVVLHQFLVGLGMSDKSLAPQAQRDSFDRAVRRPTSPRDLEWPKRSLRLPLPGSSACASMEACGIGALSAAALGAVGYGFMCASGFMQNWAQFQAGIERLIQ